MSIFSTIGGRVKAEESSMVEQRVAQVTKDDADKDDAIKGINEDKSDKFDTLSADVNAAYVAKGALLLAKKNEMETAINALVTNATENVDSITELISYLNANNADWISTLAAKKTSLDSSLASEISDTGDYNAFAGAWDVA
jgi:hypothetical protein